MTCFVNFIAYEQMVVSHSVTVVLNNIFFKSSDTWRRLLVHLHAHGTESLKRERRHR